MSAGSSLGVACFLALALHGPTRAGPESIGVPLGEARLDSLRGGFDDGHGLRASFGLERATYINGALVASQSIHIADLSRISEAQASQLRAALGGMTVVNNGGGNTVTGSASPALAGVTVIQNTLNDQSIKGVTVLNASTNSLGLLRNLTAGAVLRDALTAPLVTRP